MSQPQDDGLIAIEVVLALPTEQPSVSLRVAPGTTIRDAIARSALLERFPQFDCAPIKVGRWNRVAMLDDLVNAGDRVEIYRPLQIDPKQVRKLRAEQDRKRR